MKNAWDYLHIRHGAGKEREKCLVVSDLHFGAPYSDAYAADILLEEQLEDPSVKHCVLLGDIYELLNIPDNKEPGTFEKYTKRHIGHLRRLVQDHPNCTFHFVAGNHERLPQFDQAIDALAQELGPDRLTVSRHFIKIGDGLFMHGDQAMNPSKYGLPDKACDAYEDLNERYKSSYEEAFRNPVAQNFHDIGNVHAPYLVGRMLFRAEQCARRIFTWAHEYDKRNPPKQYGYKSVNKLSLFHPDGILSDVKHIFMGHTHDPFTGKEYSDPATGQSYRFYNSGASVYRMGRINRHCFNAMNFYLNDSNQIEEVHSVKWPQHHWVDHTSETATSHIAQLLAQEKGRVNQR